MKSVAMARRPAVPLLALLCTLLLCTGTPRQPAVAGPNVSAPALSADPPVPPPLPWPAVQPIVDSEEVGYLPGNGVVTAAGDYQYTLPIHVPDGRAGMKPSIALRYSSRGGSTANGTVGVGWSLDHGGSKITRCARSFLHDGKTDTPSFRSNDALCLDGQRLVQVNAVAPMSEGAEYRTFRDTFAKIVAHGSADAPSFEAFAKDGRVLTFLPTSAEVSLNDGSVAQVTAAWLLVEERDRAGNAILYHHETEPDLTQHRISSIEYTARMDDHGDVLREARRSVTFEYSNERPDRLFRYRGGVLRSIRRRLTGIKVFAPNPVEEGLVTQYRLTYEVGQQHSFLAGVRRFDGHGRRMWERTFEWAHDNRPHFLVMDPPTLVGAFHEAQPLLFDADNDGREELLLGSRFCYTTPGSVTPFDICVTGTSVLGLWGRPADVNGDGKVDVLRRTAAGRVFYVTWNGSDFEPISHGDLSDPQVDSTPNLNLIDANGDGLIDAFVVGPRANPHVDYYEHEWYLRLNTGTGFADPVAPLVAAPFLYGRKSVAMDLDNNGRGELHTGFHPSDEPPRECAQSPSPPWRYSAIGFRDDGQLASDVVTPAGSPCTKVLIDLNGDGLRDIFVAQGPSSTVRYNTGTRFLPAEPFHLSMPLYPRLGKHNFEVADVDGDGREDLISANEASSDRGHDHRPHTRLYLRRNQGFKVVDLGEAPYEIPAYDPEDFPPHHEDQSPTIRVGDVNGDGLSDLVVVIRDGSADTSKVRVLLQQWEPNGVLVGVRDEQGTDPRESVFYSPYSTDTPSPSTCTYPTRCLRGGNVVAREHWVHRQDVPSAIRRTAYEFDDLRMDLRGRGMLGFGKVRAVDLDSFAETITLYDHATVDEGRYPFAGLPRDVWRITPILKTSPDAAGGVQLPGPGGGITARVVYTHHEYERRLTNDERTFMVFESATMTEEREDPVELRAEGLAIKHSTYPLRIRHTSREVDDFGTEVSSSAWTEGGLRCEGVTSVQNDTASWLIGLPQSTSMSCDQNGLPLPEARLQTMEHDSRGLLAKVTVEPNHPELRTVTTYRRNAYGLVTKVMVSAEGELPRETLLAYDEESVYPRATWNARGQVRRQLVHPAYGVPLLTEDPNGVQVHYRYDGFGRVREILPDDGAGTVISYQRDARRPWAIVVEEAHEDGGASQALIDEHGRTLASARVGFDGQWIHERTTYNRFGQRTEDYRPTTGQLPFLKTVTIYDTLGRVVETTEPNGATTRSEHSFAQSVTTDAEGRKHKTIKNADDHVVLSADLHEGRWIGSVYHYGAFGQAVKTIDGEGNAVVVTYDKLGRRTSLRDPDRGLTTWTYNGFGETVAEVDAEGDTTLFHRDELGRLTSTAHDLNGITTFVYDGARQPGEIGHLTSAASPDGVVTAHEYDVLGRNTRTSWTVEAESYDVARTYDGFSRIDTLQYPSPGGRGAFVAKYTYNRYGFTKAVSDATDPAMSARLWTVHSRNEDGLLHQSASGNGVAETRQYDPTTGRLTNIEAVKDGTALYAMHYLRDRTGNVRARDDHAQAAPRRERFRYDGLDRLVFWSVEAGTEQRESRYQYDALGNLTRVRRGATMETLAYESRRPHALTSRTVDVERVAHATTYTYDGRGRQVTGGGREITWTPFDLPSTLTQDGETTSFLYDAFGTRIRKVRASGRALEGVDTVAGLYERRYRPGSPTRHVYYVHGTDGPVAQLVVEEGAKEPETLFVHQDALGSVGLVTDSQGTDVERTYHEPFGQKVDVSGKSVSPLLGDVKLGFTGHRHDDDLGLIDMKGRIYDPLQRRFLTPDPFVPDVLFSQSYNRYAYVYNNPVRHTDPTGFMPPEGDAKRTPFIIEIVVPAHGPDDEEPPIVKSSSSDGHGYTPPVNLPETTDERPGCGGGFPRLSPDTTQKSFFDRMSWGGAAGQDLRDHPIAQGIAGFVGGLSLGIVPYAGVGEGIAQDLGITNGATRDFNIGKGLGEIVGGLFTFAGGVGGVTGGGAATATGIGATVGVPAIIVSATAVAGGLANVAAGLTNLSMAMSQGSGNQKPPSATKATSQIDRTAFKARRQAFWKQEAKNNPGKYSASDLAKMEKGQAPTGADGHPVELHHVDRTPEGGLTPMTRTEHRLGVNYKKNHL